MKLLTPNNDVHLNKDKQQTLSLLCKNLEQQMFSRFIMVYNESHSLGSCDLLRSMWEILESIAVSLKNAHY